MTAVNIEQGKKPQTLPNGDLPEGWETASLGELVTLRKGKKPKKLDEALWPGAVPYIDIEAFEKGNIRRYADSDSSVFVNAGDVLIVWDGARCGYVGKAPVGGALGSTLGKVEPASIHPDYMFRFLQLSYETVNSNPRGIGIPHVEPELFWNLKVPIAPLSEQKRIAAKVEQLLARVNAARERLAKVQTILKRFRQAILAAACSGRLTADWRAAKASVKFASQQLEIVLNERRKKWESGELSKMGMFDTLSKNKKWKQKYREPLSPTISDLPDILETWTWATIDQLTAHEPNTITDGPFGSNLKTEHYTEAGPRVIRLQNIGDGIFIDEYAHISSERFEKLSKHRIFSDDVAIAALGDSIPRACVLPPSVGSAIVKADCIRFKAHSELADSFYITYALNDQATRRRMTELVHGVGRARLNLGEIKAIPIPLPPLIEQREIVNRVEALFNLADKIEKRVAAVTERAEKLTQVILSKAFCGELVPIEAELARREGRSYEPAAVLLARIKAQRQGEKTPKVPHPRFANRRE